MVVVNKDLHQADRSFFKNHWKPIINFLETNPDLYDKAREMAEIEADLIVKRADAVMKALITGNTEDPLI